MKQPLFKKLRLYSFFALILLTVAIIYSIAPVKTQTTTISVIDAVEGDDTIELPPETPAGTTVLVNITVTDVTLLAGWQINVTFDPRLLNITDPTDIFLPEDHIFNGLDPWTAPEEPEINYYAGWVLWGCVIGPLAPVNNFNGSGTMCQIRFTTVKNGTGEPFTCEIVLDTLDAPTCFPTMLVDPDSNEIPFTTVKGYFIIPEFSIATLLTIFLMTSAIIVLIRKTWIIRHVHRNL
jgi:hypothetical protein